MKIHLPMRRPFHLQTLAHFFCKTERKLLVSKCEYHFLPKYNISHLDFHRMWDVPSEGPSLIMTRGEPVVGSSGSVKFLCITSDRWLEKRKVETRKWGMISWQGINTCIYDNPAYPGRLGSPRELDLPKSRAVKTCSMHCAGLKDDGRAWCRAHNILCGVPCPAGAGPGFNWGFFGVACKCLLGVCDWGIFFVRS